MNIVIVDDERVSLALLKSLVAKIAEARPVVFLRPSEALDWCTQHEPDVVIVDYVMPEMDGIEFTQRFRALRGKSEIPMLMVTATRDRVLRHRALSIGINDFLTKPFDSIELTARLQNMLALRSTQRNLAERAQQLAREAAKNRQAALDVAARERETLMCLCLAAERRQPETHEHFVRLALYSELIGLRMGLSREDAERLRLAAPLHDVGKLGIPDHILLKTGKLTDAEWETMRQHTVMGAEILGQSESPILKAGAEIAISHHENFDGSGYPYGLSGYAIPMSGRIVAVATVFDALTSAKPYKPAWEVSRALSVMKDSTGTQFSPDCMEAFFEVIDDVLEVKARLADGPTATLGAAA